MTKDAQQQGTTMPKIQKSFMVQEDLYRLIEAVESRSGANFTRIVTAALLSYLFRAFEEPEQGMSRGPDPLWLQMVVGVDRGDVEIGDIPLSLLDRWIDLRRRYLTSLTEEDPEKHKDQIAALSKELKQVKEIRRGWKNNVEDFGKLEAYIEEINFMWRKPLPQ